MEKKIEIERIWAMPSRWTFKIKPIKELLEKEIGSGMFLNGKGCDPFAGKFSPAQITNDLNPKRKTTYHLEALEFLALMPDNEFDWVLFDPPYSPRQVKECYENIGQSTVAEHTRQDFWSKCKDEIARITKKGGKVFCFGWNSGGMGRVRGFEMVKILLVPHGGNKNDTIVTLEIASPPEPIK